MRPDPQPSHDRPAFLSRMQAQHGRVDPCFMTGKGCVYTDPIERELKERHRKGRLQGFVIMPFRQNLEVVLENCIDPFFQSNYALPEAEIHLRKGDHTRRPGVVICEGVCKRIQESDFILVDLSLPNPNVFYELGLAYGIGQKIVVVYKDGQKVGIDGQEQEFGKNIAQYLGCRSYAYKDLFPIRKEDFSVSDHVWVRPRQARPLEEKPKLLFYEHLLRGSVPTGGAAPHHEPPTEDITLSFPTQVASAVGRAIETILLDLDRDKDSARVIYGNRDTITGLQTLHPLLPEPSSQLMTGQFLEIRNQIDNCYCLIIQTATVCHPMAYFWLGYGHAIGKNVIPITIVEDGQKPDDLAFDIRAQRHMTFLPERPKLLVPELTETLRQMIWTDFAEWSRKKFWDTILERRGQVSIFTGALHAEPFDRDMVGDWDLRAVAELAAYFGRHHYRAKIETPVYQPDFKRISKQDYIRQLIAMMAGKNCILIASPDVNPLTEIVLGRIYGLDESMLFAKTEPTPEMVVALKEKAPDAAAQSGPDRDDADRAFYSETPTGDPATSRRGFLWRGRKFLHEYRGQRGEADTFQVYAHLAIIPNPFGDSSKYIAVLNGISGPATFALTHVLTGGIIEEFVNYGEERFDREAESEVFLRDLVKEMGLLGSGRKALECLIKVRVGRAKIDTPTGVANTFDWRHILGWEIELLQGRAFHIS